MKTRTRSRKITVGAAVSAAKGARGTRATTIKTRKNGKHVVDARSTMALPLNSLQRILRPQAAFRWILPSLAAITPQYVEMILRGALAGNHVQQWELFDLMLDSWPELSACQQELSY